MNDNPASHWGAMSFEHLRSPQVIKGLYRVVFTKNLLPDGYQITRYYDDANDLAKLLDTPGVEIISLIQLSTTQVIK